MNVDVVRQPARLPLSRVQNLKYRELVECCLCQGLLFDPVACLQCEGVVCSACIHLYNSTRPAPVCPHGCPTYTERSCARSIYYILSTLTISCRYEPNGCLEELPYQDLEAHENECVYQLLTCMGCEGDIIQLNFTEHQNQCPLVSITCDQCSTSFRRRDAHFHTMNECLRVQVEEQRSQLNQLQSREREQQAKIDVMEQQLRKYERLWMGFFHTTNQIRGMLDEPIDYSPGADTSLL